MSPITRVMRLKSKKLKKLKKKKVTIDQVDSNFATLKLFLKESDTSYNLQSFASQNESKKNTHSMFEYSLSHSPQNSDS